MTTERLDSIRESMTLRDVLNRLSDLLSRPSLPPPRFIADVSETLDGTAYLIEAPVPGLTPDEIKIQASGDLLTVEVQPRASAGGEERTYLTRELQREPMARVFAFPTTIDVDNVQAWLERGMLHVRVPKAEGAPSRVIKVEG